MSENQTKEAREPKSLSIVRMADRIAGLSVDINRRVGEKLMPVTIPTSEAISDKAKEIQESMPELFETIRNSLTTIERNLLSIADSVERAEI